MLLNVIALGNNQQEEGASSVVSSETPSPIECDEA